MPQELPRTATPPVSTMPKVNALSVADLRACLFEGLSDFARAPLFGLFFGAVFALIGIIIVLGLTWWKTPWMIYPFAIGFPLVGPFAPVNATVGRYLLLGLLVSVLAAAPGVVIVSVIGAAGGLSEEGGLLQSLTIGAAFLAAVIVFARLQLVFPGVAIGDPAGLKGSWRLTRGNGGRLLPRPAGHA